MAFRSYFVFTILFACRLIGQTSQVPYEPLQGGPTFRIQQVDYSCDRSVASIRAVDFRNFTFPIFDKAGAPIQRLSLKHGAYKHDEPLSHSTLSLDWIHYLGTSRSGESALALLSWTAAGGSSSEGRLAYVFTLSKKHLRIVQALGVDTHFWTKERTESFDPGTEVLVVRSAHYISGDAHCCVSAMDVITLHWDGERFTPTDIRTELSEYGKREGKTLPR